MLKMFLTSFLYIFPRQSMCIIVIKYQKGFRCEVVASWESQKCSAFLESTGNVFYLRKEDRGKEGDSCAIWLKSKETGAEKAV